MFVRPILFLTIVFLTVASGCTDASKSAVRPESRPLGREFGTFEPPAKPAEIVPGVSNAPDVAEPNGVLTLREALAQALVHNPELRAFSWGVRASEARKLQAGLSPNPEIGVEVEEVGGTGPRSGFGGAQTTLQLGLLIEVAGKRSKREQVALLESTLAGWDYEAKRLDVLTRTTHAFVGVLAVQERLKLAEESVELSERILNTVAQRVAAGKDSPVEETKAQVALASARIEEKQARQRLASARKRLATTWGSTTPVFEVAGGELDVVSPIPSESEVTRLLEQNPDLARWATEIQRRRAALKLAKANGVPDPTIFGGMQRFGEDSDTGAVFGLAIPIGVSNRNQGGILEASHNLARAREMQRAAETSLEADLSDAYQALASAFIEVTDLKNEVLPGAESAFGAARRGYSEGKFDYLPVLDAQRTLFESKAKYIEALASYHRARADVERLIGQSLESLEGKNND